MWATVFAAILAGFWLATVLTAFCPLRAYRRRKELLEEENCTFDSGQG
ncbi:hypothetical protein [Desulfuromonas versatilis]|nr:hypothetical protein [Desulfuromonas versatilis]